MEHTCSKCLGHGEIILRPATKITNYILMVPWGNITWKDLKRKLKRKHKKKSQKKVKIQTKDNLDMPWKIYQVLQNNSFHSEMKQ